MLKVVQPQRMTNPMGYTQVPELDFENADNWDVVEGSLVLFDSEGIGVAQFAPGHWSYVILVD